MLPSQLYGCIIDEERKGYSDASLRKAAKSVAASYNQEALKKGATFLDYSKPQNRCAYLYKYAPVHTSSVTKMFRKLVKIKAVRKIINQKKDLKISCLGGGPGTDIVGLFRALSIFPYMHRKVSEANVLDISIGWHNSFNHIVKNIVAGKVKDIPETFLKENFKANFMEVNLLEPLPNHVEKAISSADVITMVKFVSAILGKKDSLKALKTIADLFKIGAIILFIDNFQENVGESIESISKQVGLNRVLGPEVEHFHYYTEAKRSMFGCEPLKHGRVRVLGFIKTENKVNLNQPINLNYCGDKSDDGWDTDSDDPDLVLNEIPTENLSLVTPVLKDCDKPTEKNEFENRSQSTPYDTKDLNDLVTALAELLTVLTKLELKESCCCCCCCCKRSHH